MQASFPEAMVITDPDEERLTNIKYDVEPSVIAFGVGVGIEAKTIAAFEEFLKTNKSPLVIDRIQSSCGCTVPKKPTEPIMPGGVGEIEVKYNTHTAGGFSKSITVYSNASEPTKMLRIKGIVLKPESEVVKQKSTISS